MAKQALPDVLVKVFNQVGLVCWMTVNKEGTPRW
jgi:hypothetical protein